MSRKERRASLPPLYAALTTAVSPPPKKERDEEKVGECVWICGSCGPIYKIENILWERKVYLPSFWTAARKRYLTKKKENKKKVSSSSRSVGMMTDRHVFGESVVSEDHFRRRRRRRQKVRKWSLSKKKGFW